MRKEKQFLLDGIQEHIEGAKGLVILSYKGLSANAVNDFRAGAEKIGGYVAMVPKRVLVKGALQAGLTLDRTELAGHIGLVIAQDDNALELAKFVVGYSETSEKTVQVIGGRFEGQLYSGEDVEKLSKLPGMNEMRSQFLAVLEAPLSQTLATVEAILCSVIYCLNNKSQAADGSSDSQQ